jgi:hypothetical protein
MLVRIIIISLKDPKMMGATQSSSVKYEESQGSERGRGRGENNRSNAESSEEPPLRGSRHLTPNEEAIKS